MSIRGSYPLDVIAQSLAHHRWTSLRALELDQMFWEDRAGPLIEFLAAHPTLEVVRLQNAGNGPVGRPPWLLPSHGFLPRLKTFYGPSSFTNMLLVLQQQEQRPIEHLGCIHLAEGRVATTLASLARLPKLRDIDISCRVNCIVEISQALGTRCFPLPARTTPAKRQHELAVKCPLSLGRAS